MNRGGGYGTGVDGVVYNSFWSPVFALEPLTISLFGGFWSMPPAYGFGGCWGGQRGEDEREGEREREGDARDEEGEVNVKVMV